MYNRIGEAEDYDSNFGDTQESNNRYKTITIKIIESIQMESTKNSN